jgi:hypothetical protein
MVGTLINCEVVKALLSDMRIQVHILGFRSLATGCVLFLELTIDEKGLHAGRLRAVLVRYESFSNLWRGRYEFRERQE